MFCIYSYTKIFSPCSMQHPRSLTRLECCNFRTSLTSFMNSFLPCFDVLESLFIAISWLSTNIPWFSKRNYIYHGGEKSRGILWLHPLYGYRLSSDHSSYKRDTLGMMMKIMVEKQQPYIEKAFCYHRQKSRPRYYHM